jgi:hypothetical protein
MLYFVQYPGRVECFSNTLASCLLFLLLLLVGAPQQNKSVMSSALATEDSKAGTSTRLKEIEILEGPLLKVR